MAYAASTDVPVERSRAELERTLERYGATSFAYATEPGRAMVMFESTGRRVRFVLPLPQRDNPTFTRHSRGARTPAAALASWEQACRQKWRALNLVVKAKLESIEAGIATFDEEFLAWVVLPDGTTVGDRTIPAMAETYLTGGTLPALMPGGSS